MTSSIWDDFLALISQEVGSRVVETWFKAVTLQRWDPLLQVVYLEAPNAFVRDWIQSNYMKLMQVHLGRLLQVQEPRVIILDTRRKEELVKQTEATSLDKVAHARHRPSPKSNLIKIHPTHMSCAVNTLYSFDSFVVGKQNALACAAAKAVIEEPGVMYNPLCICSGPGLGKTHLLHAIRNSMRQHHEERTVIYQAADRFVHEFVNAARTNNIAQFHARYEKAEVLLMDDIQCIANKEQTQEAFYHIFNKLYDDHKQIIFSSDTPPSKLTGISERLQSRFSWGLVTDIGIPDIETKMAIIQKKALLRNNIALQDSVAEAIALRPYNNIRELEGAIIRILAYTTLTKQKISSDLIDSLLGQVVPQIGQSQQANITVDMILEHVAHHFQYTVRELTSKSRQKELTHARHIAVFLMKKLTDGSLREIGKYFGNRDHATIAHAIKKIEQAAQLDKNIELTIKTLEKSLT